MTANTVKQLDSVLETFTGSSLTGLISRYLEGREGGGNGGGPATPKPKE
jgi:hypothetical protein